MKKIMDKVEVMLFGMPMNVAFMDKKELLKKDVRYIGTDFSDDDEIDLYEDNRTGEVLATRL